MKAFIEQTYPEKLKHNDVTIVQVLFPQLHPGYTEPVTPGTFPVSQVTASMMTKWLSAVKASFLIGVEEDQPQFALINSITSFVGLAEIDHGGGWNPSGTYFPGSLVGHYPAATLIVEYPGSWPTVEDQRGIFPKYNPLEETRPFWDWLRDSNMRFHVAHHEDYPIAPHVRINHLENYSENGGTDTFDRLVKLGGTAPDVVYLENAHIDPSVIGHWYNRKRV